MKLKVSPMHQITSKQQQYFTPNTKTMASLQVIGLVLLLACFGGIETRHLIQPQQLETAAAPQQTVASSTKPMRSQLFQQPPLQIKPTVSPVAPLVAPRQPTVISNTNTNYNSQPARPQHHYFQSGQHHRAQYPPQAGVPLYNSNSNNNNHHHSHHQHHNKLTVCQLPSHLVNLTKCSSHQEEGFRRDAMTDFQLKLGESSGELQFLLSSYLNEFKSLSLGLVLVAKNNTLSKLERSLAAYPQLGSQISNLFDQRNLLESTRRLYDSMFDHLDKFDTTTATGAGELADHAFIRLGGGSPMSPFGDINNEISAYFRKVNLIFMKRQLSLKLQSHPQNQNQNHNQLNGLEFNCLDMNLQRQQEFEALRGELLPVGGPAAAAAAATGSGDSLAVASTSEISNEQEKLQQSIRQSLEFARTLLSSLSLAKSMFQNLTQQANDWIPNSSCRDALTRMTVCGGCHPLGGAQTGGQLGAAVRLPCENYCLNVVNGCMSDIYELHPFWQRHVNALIRFKSNMIQANNIENVMSNLDERILTFISKLSQQYNQHSATISPPPPSAGAAADPSQLVNTQSAKLIRLCPVRSARNVPLAAVASHQLTQLPPRGPRVLPANQMPASGSAASNRLHQATNYYHQLMRQYESVAQQARQSPMWSLFNRLDGFVAQLQMSRDFFADWPARVCNRVRSNGSQQVVNRSQQQQQPKVTNSTSECWNGRDFSGYTKPLAPLGQVINSNHPEVAVNSEPINPIVLNLIEKLKLVAGQLQVRSTRSPQVYTIAADTSQQQVSGARDLPVPQSLSQVAPHDRRASTAQQVDSSGRGMSQQQALAAAAALASSPSGVSALASDADDESNGAEESAGSQQVPVTSSPMSAGEADASSGQRNGEQSGESHGGDAEELASGESEVSSSAADASDSDSNDTDEANAETTQEGDEDEDEGDSEPDAPCTSNDCVEILPDQTEQSKQPQFASTNSIVTMPNTHLASNHIPTGETVYPISTVDFNVGERLRDSPYSSRPTTVYDSRYTNPYHPSPQYTTKYQMPPPFDPLNPPPINPMGNDIQQNDAFVSSSSSSSITSHPILLLLITLQSLACLMIFAPHNQNQQRNWLMCLPVS